MNTDFCEKAVSSIWKRNNFIPPKILLEKPPQEIKEQPEIKHKLNERIKTKKVIFSSIEEIKEASVHFLEDITEIKFVLQQYEFIS